MLKLLWDQLAILIAVIVISSVLVESEYSLKYILLVCVYKIDATIASGNASNP